MIERKFVAERIREFLVHSYLTKEMGAGKFSSFEIKRTPLGEKVIIYTARPGLIVGKKGDTIKNLTKILKTQFKLENPQIEVAEVSNPACDAQTVSEQIVTAFERYGPKRFKSLGYQTLQRIMDGGAIGAEIRISGRGLPGSRAKSWRFYAGYLKKSGDVAMSLVHYGFCTANLKSGTIGVKVKILLSDVILPDKILMKDLPETKLESVEQKTTVEEALKEEVAEEKPKKTRPRKKIKEIPTEVTGESV